MINSPHEHGHGRIFGAEHFPFRNQRLFLELLERFGLATRRHPLLLSVECKFKNLKSKNYIDWTKTAIWTAPKSRKMTLNDRNTCCSSSRKKAPPVDATKSGLSKHRKWEVARARTDFRGVNWLFVQRNWTFVRAVLRLWSTWDGLVSDGKVVFW